MMATRLMVIAANGDHLKVPSSDGTRNELLGVDLTGIDNADSSVSLSLAVERQCDQGYWHTIARTALPVYSPAEDEASRFA